MRLDSATDSYSLNGKEIEFRFVFFALRLFSLFPHKEKGFLIGGNVKKSNVKKIPTKEIVLYALLTALTTAATFAVKIPTVATQGYMNIGDTVLLFAGIVFGPLAGFIAGGLGSCLADLAGGYAHWILPTFIIKGAEGALVGGLFMLFRKLRLNKHLAVWLSLIPSAILMVFGYFVASWIMKGSAATALTSVPENCMQGVFGMVACYALLLATGKIKGVNKAVGRNLYYDYPKDEQKIDLSVSNDTNINKNSNTSDIKDDERRREE